jgi:hypothetical protein
MAIERNLIDTIPSRISVLIDCGMSTFKRELFALEVKDGEQDSNIPEGYLSTIRKKAKYEFYHKQNSYQCQKPNLSILYKNAFTFYLREGNEIGSIPCSLW